MKYLKKAGFQTLISTFLLLFFFCEWLNISFVNLTLSAAELPFSLDKLDFLRETLHLEDLSFLKISYLLYLIPLTVIVHIVTDLRGNKHWLWKLDYVVVIIAVIVMKGIIVAIAPDDPSYLGYGFMLSLLFAIIGILLQISSAIYRKVQRKK